MLLTSLFNVLSKNRDNSSEPLVDVYQIAFFCSMCCYTDINNLINHFYLMNDIKSTIEYTQLLELLHLLIHLSLFIQYFLFVALSSRSSFCPLPFHAYNLTLSKLLDSMNITSAGPIHSHDVFFAILRQAKLFLPYTEVIELPITHSSVTVQMCTWIKKYYSQFMTCTDEVEKIAKNDPSSCIYFGDVVSSLFSNLYCSQDDNDLLWEVCTSLWKVAVFYSGSTNGSSRFVDWLRCVTSLFQSNDIIRRLSLVIHGDDDNWSFYDLYQFVECMLHIYDEVL